MNEWISLSSPNDSGEWARSMPKSKWIIIETFFNEKVEKAIFLTYEEVFNLSLQVPEIKALIKWAFDVRETMSDADLFVHGVEELVPFMKGENHV